MGEEKFGRVLITTLGHVDHGKSTLVRVLTGIDPDRLPEEKILERTTDLGFAFFQANNGKLYGFIDVPGHRDYIKNLIIGILNAHFYILVVDAKEGIMPQTVEHIELVKYLKLKYGIVVISKIDLVSVQRIKEVDEEIKLLYNENELEIVPIVAVSFANNTGIEELKNKLSECLDKTPPYISNSTEFIFAVMRSFTVTGRGTVVTGPVIKGSIKKGDMIFSRVGSSVVREIQIFRNPENMALSGLTAALNVPDLEASQAKRGLIITGEAGAEWILTSSCLVLLEHHPNIKKYLDKKSFTPLVFLLTSCHRVKIKFIKHFSHFSLGALMFLGDFYPAFSGIRFVCYSSDLKHFLGVGYILYTNIEGLNDQNFIKIFSQNFDYQSYQKKPLDYLLYQFTYHHPLTSLETLDTLFNTGDFLHIIHNNPDFLVYNSYNVVNLQKIYCLIKEYLQKFHSSNPYQYGLKIKDFSEYLRLPRDITGKILSNMVERGEIGCYHDFYFLSDFKVKHDESIIQDVEKLRNLFLANIFLTYSRDEIKELFKGNEKIMLAFDKLTADRELIHLQNNRWIAEKGIEKIKEILYENKEKLRYGFSPKDLKPLLADISRKHLIPLLEYLDKIGVTKRSGEKRFIK
ncbi:MAG: SelB C-terminal domain-containing protein [Planctomycetota bacterium]